MQQNKWKYVIRFKEGRIKSVAEESSILKEVKEKKHAKGEKSENCTWINDITYNQRSVNLIEADIESDDNDKKYYVFISDIRITKRNADEIMCFGRSRWKIENQGFNNQKTKRYNIEHANGMNYNAMKNHYLITQMIGIFGSYSYCQVNAGNFFQYKYSIIMFAKVSRFYSTVLLTW
ncbi:MAG: hypothetical protein AB7G87_08130 [Clostridia bacterium]